MYYINQLDYPHIRYEHDLDNGGARRKSVRLRLRPAALAAFA